MQSKHVEAKLQDLEGQAEDERQALLELNRQDQVPIRLPSPKEIEGRVFDLCEILSGDTAEGREALRRLFKDGKVRVKLADDGVFVATTELLPLAEEAIAAPGGSPGAAIYGGSSGGRI